MLFRSAAAGGVRQVHALKFLEALDPLGDGVEVGEHATQPALVDVRHANPDGPHGVWNTASMPSEEAVK